MSELVRKNIFVIKQNINLVDALISNLNFILSKEKSLSFIEQKRILVNNKLVNSDCKLKENDEVVLLTPQSLEPKVNSDYKIIYDDDYILVIDKPANLPVHPAGKFYFNSLTSMLINNGVVEDSKLHTVHRLDRETSGVIVFAKSKVVASFLQKQFLSNKVNKIYYAISFNSPNLKKGVVSLPIKSVQMGGFRDHVVVDKTGLVAETQYEVLEEQQKFSLFKLKLITGRTHQIRVHLQSLGTPIVGDKEYGPYPELFLRYFNDPDACEQEILSKLLSNRQFLHCGELSFIHPNNSNFVSFKCDLHPDMLDFLEKKGFAYNV